MIITGSRTSIVVSAGFAGLVLALSPVAAQAHTLDRGMDRAGGDRISIDRTVRVGEDGAVTVSGTYRCSGHSGTVLVGGKVRQQGRDASIGGSVATCDGNEHRWSNTEQTRVAIEPGAARGEATLLELEPTGGVIPLLPNVLATHARDVVVERG
ncbi:DUF6299 family protein [Embleya sp. NBC_00896]|uniref:DUF6299 family protein n=1 Tax=Embleya sp. NBC_00896 TaxID=2975961 RepID=UPI00386563BC|nr:DUF6299 family protein [Embleya sp. NBC_00896]